MPTKIPQEPKTQIREKKKKNPPDHYHIHRAKPSLAILSETIIDNIGNPPISTEKPTNLHRSIPTPILRSSRLSLHQSPPHVHHDPLHAGTLQRLQTRVHRFPPIHRVVHRHAIQRHHQGEIGLCHEEIGLEFRRELRCGA